jgi:hypothetical protein
MPLNLSDWASIAAIVSAMCDVISVGRETFEQAFNRRSNAPDANDRGAILAKAMSTYSDEEVEAIRDRLDGCRQRFISEGSGPNRATCLCSVLQDVKDGNGGSIPFDDWARTYETLGCSTRI